MELDKTIRFAGIASIEGKLIAQEYRKGLRSLLTKEESELSVMQSIIRMGTRKTFEEKVGKTIYAFALYEKVKRATIPLDKRQRLTTQPMRVAKRHSKTLPEP